MFDIIMTVLLLSPPKPPTDGLTDDLLKLAHCESSNRPTVVSRTGKYRGLYQFDLPTWQSVGGTGDPAKAPRAEQLKRAKILYHNRGWNPWPQCAPKLGLKDKWRNK
jgi:hypothetical protein